MTCEDCQETTCICVVVDVPGCTCHERTQEQLDRADVCPACVSYFDLHDGLYDAELAADRILEQQEMEEIDGGL